MRKLLCNGKDSAMPVTGSSKYIVCTSAKSCVARVEEAVRDVVTEDRTYDAAAARDGEAVRHTESRRLQG